MELFLFIFERLHLARYSSITSCSGSVGLGMLCDSLLHQSLSDLENENEKTNKQNLFNAYNSQFSIWWIPSERFH